MPSIFEIEDFKPPWKTVEVPRMIPESKLIKSEIVIREMSLPQDVMLAKKSLVRWIALSLGLILPNESRTLLLDVLDSLIYFHVKRENPTTQDILSRLKKQTKTEPNPKAVYYHLLKLKDAGILMRKKGRYSLSEDEGKSLPELFREIYLRKANSAFANLDSALKKLENSY
jgi:DNA-binding PadR family transcriptional regulator